MKNNKGFSIVELIVSFSICMVVVVMLFEIVIVLKETLEKSEIKTQLYNTQNVLVEQIYDDLLEKKFESISKCNGNCIQITYKDGTSKTLKYNNSTIEYGDYATKVLNNTNIGNITYDEGNNILTINLPITHPLFSNIDFGINVVHIIS